MEFAADNLEHAVAQFYHTDAAMQAHAHKWLTEAQNSPQAWGFVWELLQPDKSAEVQFFAATTLHTKVVKSWHEIPVSEYPALKKQLLEAIASYCVGPKIVLNRLCIALSAYVLQTLPTHWPNAIAELLATLQPSNLPSIPPERTAWILLQILTVLPEEFQSSHIAQQQKALVRNELHNNIPQVLSLLEEILSAPVQPNEAAYEVSHQGVLCAVAWLQLGVPLTDSERLADRLVDMVFTCSVEGHHASGLVESSLDALSNMATHPDSHKYPQSVLKLVAKLLPLQTIVQQQRQQQHNREEHDQDLISNVYGLLISLAESHSRLLLETLAANTCDAVNVLQLIQVILECSNSPGVYPTQETTSHLAMGFWFILQDDMLATAPDQLGAIMPLLAPVYRALAEVMLRKSVLPAHNDNAWTSEDRESLRCYRQDVADTMMYCYAVLQDGLLEILESSLCAALAACRDDGNGQTAGWQLLESCLHAFYSIAECVDVDEEVYLPRFLAAIQRLPFQRLDVKVVATALEAVGAYAEWINAHPSVLSNVVPLLVMGLTNADVAPPATMALKDLTRDCQMSMKPFAHLILQASQEALHGGHLKLSECVRLMYTVGRVLAVLPVDNIMDYLNQILMPYIEELQHLVTQEPSALVKGGILLRLKMMAMLFTTLDIRPQRDENGPPEPPEPARQVQPVFLVLQRVLPVMQAVANKWCADTHVIQAVCAILKHALTTLLDDSRPLLMGMLELLVKSYQMQPNPAALDLARQFVVLYGREEVHTMQSLLRELCNVTLRTVSGSDAESSSALMTEHTDVLEGFFNLLAQILKKNPQLLAGTADVDIAAVFTCGTETLGVQENPTIKAAASFLVQFVSQSRDLPALVNVVQAGGEALVLKVLRCIGGESPRSAIEPMSDILLALNKKYCDNLCRWLNQAMAQDGFPSPRATKQQSVNFAKAVLRERANRRKLQETVREFSLVCRGLIGTEYAAQRSLVFS